MKHFFMHGYERNPIGLVIATALVGTAFFLYAPPATAQEQLQAPQMKIVRDYGEQMKFRIWNLEDRLRQRPDDTDLQNQLLTLRTEYRQYLREQIQQLQQSQTKQKATDQSPVREELTRLQAEYRQQLEYSLRLLQQRLEQQPDDPAIRERLNSLREEQQRLEGDAPPPPPPPE